MADVTADWQASTLSRGCHRLHRNPESGFEEKETARFVVEQLKSDIVEGVGGTGVVTLRRFRD